MHVVRRLCRVPCCETPPLHTEHTATGCNQTPSHRRTRHKLRQHMLLSYGHGPFSSCSPAVVHTVCVFCFFVFPPHSPLSLITSRCAALSTSREEQTGSHTPHNMTSKKANVKVSECENTAVFACIDKYVQQQLSDRLCRRHERDEDKSTISPTPTRSD